MLCVCVQYLDLCVVRVYSNQGSSVLCVYTQYLCVVFLVDAYESVPFVCCSNLLFVQHPIASHFY